MMPPRDFIWLDGRLLAADDAALSLRAAAALPAAGGLYETLRVENGAPLRWEAHMARLTAACVRLEMPLRPQEELRAAVSALLPAHGLSEARVRIDVTPAHTFIATAPLAAQPASQSLLTVPWPRNERGPFAGLKYSACPENELARRTAQAAGCGEALFLNTRGEVCEGAYSNVFAVLADGTAVTPPLSAGCLPGITRAAVLDFCRRTGVPCAERTLWPDDLRAGAEIFVTSSIRGIMPVHRLDDRSLPEPRPVTAKLQAAFQ